MSRDKRDQRDPEQLGRVIQQIRLAEPTLPLHKAVDLHSHPGGEMFGVLDYDGGGVMSADPALHHSKTPQHIDLWDGGAS